MKKLITVLCISVVSISVWHCKKDNSPTAPPTSPHLPTRDFNTLYAAGNLASRGIWSDGTTMWVADDGFGARNKIYAYNLATKAYDSRLDFNTNTLSDAGNTRPTGIWSDGTTMWVADYDDAKLYAYSMSNKAYDSSLDFNTLTNAGNTGPSGIWSDGITMWVADFIGRKLYAYAMSNKARVPAKEFNLATDNTDSRRIWSDGTTMWVVDATDDKIYAYNLATKAYDSRLDFTTLTGAGNTTPGGIWSDGTTMWVSDSENEKLYAYDARFLVNTNSLNSILTRLGLAD